MYGFLLDWNRVRELASGIPDVWSSCNAEIGKFLEHLDELSRRLRQD
jgi:hypothetical protein